MDESKDKLGLHFCVSSIDSSSHTIFLVNTQQQWAGVGLLERLCIVSREVAVTSHLDVATVDCCWLLSISWASKHNLNEYI